MNAMTWWDHETGSVWAQPWGRAIDGALEGTRLKLVPANIMPWSTWLEDHPQTLVLEVGGRGFGVRQEQFRENYVIGITLGEHAKAYPFRTASQARVLNDRLGPFPVVVVADPETKAVHAYLRRVEDEDLEFSLSDGNLIDSATGSSWDVATGFAVDGPLKGQLLKQIPYITAFDWAWEDFYPHSENFG